MTNHWIDLQNCKTILVEGSNVAENHPMAFKWIRKAQENGAKLIHVDPRYTRTSAGADVYARIRPGTDAAFQNTMINHIIVNKLYDEDYVVTHTNALFLSDEAFDFKDGVFSGYDAEHHKYDTKTWGYQLDAKRKPRVARSLDDPHCVFSRLKSFVSRYTLEMGERITGIPADQIRQIAETMAKNRPGSILYALGITPPFPGVLRYLAWTAMARFLRPVVNAFDGWRDEERWLRRYCPTCGSLPAMAQLVGVDPGRRRLLSCGCCGTRWQFKRTGCPFCETDSQRLASVTIAGEPDLRIDHCESCGGYLKTYVGQGNESLLLSDWSSLHVDLIAHDRGLKRLAASLYEFEPARQPQSGLVS